MPTPSPTWLKTNAQPTKAIAHRWRYAQAIEPLHSSALHDPNLALTIAGDWCAGSRVEGAYLSGHAAAQQILKQREAS